MASPRWKRIVFKPSGEALAGPSGAGLDGATLAHTAQEIRDIRENLDVDVAVVVGGGNFWRGRTGAMTGMDATAIAFCRDNKLPIVVFDMSAHGALRAILEGQKVGTIICD